MITDLLIILILFNTNKRKILLHVFTITSERCFMRNVKSYKTAFINVNEENIAPAGNLNGVPLAAIYHSFSTAH